MRQSSGIMGIVRSYSILAIPCVLPTILAQLERDFAGFPLLSNDSLATLDISSDCEAALSQKVLCDDFLQELGAKSDHGSLSDETLTNSVCDVGCGEALRNTHDNIKSSCEGTPNLVPGFPALAVVDRLWWAYNDTCLKGPDSDKYCNDIIATFRPYDNVSDMPEEELCSYCFSNKYKMMQQSAYSSYSADVSQPIFEDIVRRCNLNVPNTDPTPPAINVTVGHQDPPICISENEYITETGDTCDSIAQAHDVSAGTLWATSQNIVNCSSVPEGLELCLPQTCQTYQVQKGDDCVSIAREFGTTWVNIIDWNGIINANCSNLVNPTPNWGNTVCVSVPGGEYTNPPNTNGTTSPTQGDGYSNEVVDPPAGATVATNTTLSCGGWYSYQGEETCTEICLQAGVTYGLFLDVNPSLAADDCTATLQDDLYYCVHPYLWWNETETSSF
ncbi:hypothetical protein FQN54_009957 [Arachnomyces sp. PD_36]|nr:hypothetical protein FQN54_009957 [Arachnomyces sp. PD_36]